jgi:hypothetical protein
LKTEHSQFFLRREILQSLGFPLFYKVYVFVITKIRYKTRVAT